MNPFLVTFLICMALLVLFVPNEVWAFLVKAAFIIGLGFVAWWSLLFWLATMNG